MWKTIAWISAALVLIAIGVAVTLSFSGDPLSGIFPTRKLGPKAKKALEAVQSQEDLRQAEKILDRGFAHPVACGDAARAAFDPATGNSLYTWGKSPSGIIECFSGEGYHRVTGAKLEPLELDQIKIILANPAQYPSASDTPAVQTVRRAPVSVPDLSEGPCCNSK